MIEIKNYVFKNETLFERALTHSSYSQNNYERLEFLGDSILDFLIAKYYFQDKNYSEGTLSKMRAHTVSMENLSQVFDNLNIEEYVKLGKSCKSLTKSIKCDMFEAIVAAIYLDSDLKICENFVLENIFLDNEEKLELLDSKSRLQEYAQKYNLRVEYELLNQTGQAHNPTFTVCATMGEYSAVAQSSSKQIAEKEAAQNILDKIEEKQ